MDETEQPLNVGMESPQPPREPMPDDRLDDPEAISGVTAEQRIATRQQEDAKRRAKARHNRIIAVGSLAGVCVLIAAVNIFNDDTNSTGLRTSPSSLTADSPDFQPADLPQATHPAALPKPHRTDGRYIDGIPQHSSPKKPKKKQKSRKDIQPARPTFQPPAPVVAPRRTPPPPPARHPHKSPPDINLDNEPDPPAITTPSQIIIPDSLDQIPETGGVTPKPGQLPPPPVPPEDNGAARFPGTSVTGGKAFHS